MKGRIEILDKVNEDTLRKQCNHNKKYDFLEVQVTELKTRMKFAEIHILQVKEDKADRTEL